MNVKVVEKLMSSQKVLCSLYILLISIDFTVASITSKLSFNQSESHYLLINLSSNGNSVISGDNNFGDDRLLYAEGQMWLQRHHIMGRAVG